MKQFVRQAVFTILALAMPAATYAQNRTFANPITGKAESLGLSSIIGRAIQAILGVSGVAAALIIIIAGLRVVFSQGNEDSIAQGKQAIIWAVIGLVVAFGGYMIVDIILQQSAAFLPQTQ